MRSCSKWADASLGVVAVVIGLLTAAPAGSATARITVAPESTVEGSVVRLRDVATLDGAAAEALGDTPLGTAAAAGETRTIDGGLVLAALRRAGLDPHETTYTIPPTLRVRRAAQELTEPALRGIVEGFLGESLGSGASEAAVRTVETSGPIRIPTGPYTVRVIAPPGAALLGRVRLQLEFVVERPVKSVWITADIARFGPVVMARRALARGEAVAAGELEVDRRDLSQVPRDVIGDPAEAVGLLARAPVLPYTPLRREQLETPPTVHRGDVVLLIAERGGLRITTPGEVREDAGRGERVHVVNRASRKELVGRVVDADTVVVDF